jgi:hypothetical protein
MPTMQENPKEIALDLITHALNILLPRALPLSTIPAQYPRFH